MVNSTVMAPNESKTQLPPEINTEPSVSKKFQCQLCDKICSNDMDLKAHKSFHWPFTSNSRNSSILNAVGFFLKNNFLGTFHYKIYQISGGAKL